MKRGKLNIKLTAFILLFAMLLPMTLNFVSSNAFDDRAKLEEVAEKYNLDINVDNFEINLNKEVDVYLNSYDSKNKTNPVAKYGEGKYYIFKLANDSVNISRYKNSPGAWVNLESLIKSVEINEDVVKEVVSADTDKFSLYNNVNVYISAYDAINEVNSVSQYSAGEYFIFKTSGQAVNISKSENSPGGWVKITDGVKGQEVVSSSVKVVEENISKPSTSVVEEQDGKVKLSEKVNVYITAFDAVNNINPVGTRAAGEYYVFRTFGDAINISSSKNSPGGWIAKNAVSAKNTENIEERKIEAIEKTVEETVEEISLDEVTETKTVKEGDFVLYLDPGHGPGIAHNRGGVLFNEGDQNYKFAQLIIKASKKYANLAVKTTRVSNENDPSLAQRAKLSSGSDLFISLHTNASVPSVRGVEMWGSNSNTSQAFAKEVTNAWASILSTDNRGVRYDHKNGSFTRNPIVGSEDTWSVFRGNTAKEKYILESVFHTNLTDSKNFLDNQEVLADKLLEIVAKHFGLKLK